MVQQLIYCRSYQSANRGRKNTLKTNANKKNKNNYKLFKMENLNEWILKAHIIPYWDTFNEELFKKIKEVKDEKNRSN